MDLATLVQIVRDLAVAAAAVTGAALAWQRLGPAARQATAAQASAGAAGDQAALARRAYVTEQLRAAVADLRAERMEVRLAAIYMLRQIGQDFPDLADPVFETLQGYLNELDVTYSGDPEPDVAAVQETLRERLADDPNA